MHCGRSHSDKEFCWICKTPKLAVNPVPAKSIRSVITEFSRDTDELTIVSMASAIDSLRVLAGVKKQAAKDEDLALPKRLPRQAD